MSKLSKPIQSIIHGNYDELTLTEFVNLVQRISATYIKAGQSAPAWKRLGDVEDLALDCVAGLFMRNEEGEFIAFKEYFEKVPANVENLDDRAIMALLRKLVIEKTKLELTRILGKVGDATTEFPEIPKEGTANESKSRLGQSSEFAFDLYIDPGQATAQEIAEFYDALSELHRSSGGIGVTVTDNTSTIYETERAT